MFSFFWLVVFLLQVHSSANSISLFISFFWVKIRHPNFVGNKDIKMRFVKIILEQSKLDFNYCFERNYFMWFWIRGERCFYIYNILLILTMRPRLAIVISMFLFFKISIGLRLLLGFLSISTWMS